jgi:RNA polymerase sigma factor (sigma-70 family)
MSPNPTMVTVSYTNSHIFLPPAAREKTKQGIPTARCASSANFDAMCLPHTKKLFLVALRITKNREDAEDALQDSLLQAFVHFKDFDGRSTFSTWLTRITINSALMMLRKKRRAVSVSLDRTREDDGTELCIEVPDRAANPERRYLELERERILHDAIGALRPSIRRAVNIQQLQEHSLREAADLLGISVTATKGRLFHAKRLLRKSPRLKSLRRQQGRKPLPLFAAVPSTSAVVSARPAQNAAQRATL